MNQLSRRERAQASALSLLAGFVDAVGFLATGGFFVSFMSGNTTRLGVALASGHRAALVAGGLIALFVLGVTLAALLNRRARPSGRRAVLGLVAALLALAALAADLGAPGLAVACAAIAMGAENIAFEDQGEVRLGLTYMTGRLVKVGQALAAALIGEDRWAWLAHALLWAGLLAGAALGALGHALLGLDALWVAAAGVALVAAVSEARAR